MRLGRRWREWKINGIKLRIKTLEDWVERKEKDEKSHNERNPDTERERKVNSSRNAARSIINECKIIPNTQGE